MPNLNYIGRTLAQCRPCRRLDDEIAHNYVSTFGRKLQNGFGHRRVRDRDFNNN